MPDHPVPTTRARELVRGGFDPYVHVAPDFAPRRITDLELARRHRELGLAGFSLVSHYTATAERAAVVNAAVGAKVVALNADAAAPATPASTAVAAPPPAPVKAEPLPPAPKPAATAPVATTKPAVAETKPSAPAPAKPVAAATPPAPKPEPKPADTGKTGFVVQVGAFADANAATALRDKLRAAGLNAFTDSVDTDAGKRTRVRVGPAMNRAEADALKAQVKAKAGIDGIVRPHP